MIIVGIDPSLTGTGVAIVDTDDRLVVEVKTVKTKGSTAATLPERRARLSVLACRVSDLIPENADLVVIEQPAYSRTTGHMHDRSGFWWLLVDYIIGGRGMALVEVAPTGRARYATGKGNAGKDEVLLAVARRFPHVDVTNNNEADALVLAAMGADACGHPLVDMPISHRAALDGVQWSVRRGVA